MISFLLKIKESFSDWLNSLYGEGPGFQVFCHPVLTPGQEWKAKFDTILIVEDLPRYIAEMHNILENHYADAKITVGIASCHSTALEIFKEYNFSLAILDFDLQDAEGDGLDLLEKFLLEKPNLPVLANSGKPKSNKQLMKHGALYITAKKKEQLSAWLKANDAPPHL